MRAAIVEGAPLQDWAGTDRLLIGAETILLCLILLGPRDLWRFSPDVDPDGSPVSYQYLFTTSECRAS
ncbi:hypothetical protein [Sphingobium boeckii]|uniref:hypothetical protein n=1 Tax=Sphingobium boeckii TaxID=1082345 RepID=UPI0016177624|nr:hypothetical protein [Sphingobium boeckii]